MTDRETLAARIEAAGVDEQRAMLEEAYCAVAGHDPEWGMWNAEEHNKRERGGRFLTFIEHGADLDAAMMLVPEGWFTSDFHQGPSGGNWWELSRIGDGDQRYATVKGHAATPALALAAAAIRAGGV